MTENVRKRIFCVSSDDALLRTVANTLEAQGFPVECFASAAECLQQLAAEKCDLLIADAQLPDLDGIELIKEVKRVFPWQGILLFVDKGDAATAVQVIKAGALNVVEKPLERRNFLSVLKAALKETNSPDPLLGKELTRPEVEALQLILEGKSNKEVAQLRHRAVRMIEDERRRIMRKLGTDNVVDLVKRAVGMGLVELGAWQQQNARGIEREPRPLEILIHPGDATAKDLARVLAGLSALYKMTGGTGIDFRIIETREPAADHVT
jgi:FixJ family two-component response regulator